MRSERRGNASRTRSECKTDSARYRVSAFNRLSAAGTKRGCGANAG
jgi:hypothetical protein